MYNLTFYLHYIKCALLWITLKLYLLFIIFENAGIQLLTCDFVPSTIDDVDCEFRCDNHDCLRVRVSCM